MLLTKTSHSRSRSSDRPPAHEAFQPANGLEDDDEIPEDDEEELGRNADPEGAGVLVAADNGDDCLRNEEIANDPYKAMEAARHSYARMATGPELPFCYEYPPSAQPRASIHYGSPPKPFPPPPPSYEESMELYEQTATVCFPQGPSLTPSSSTGKSNLPEKGRRTRVPQACDLCRKRKARCIGGRAVGQDGPNDPGQKCQRCTKQSADCQWSFFSDTGRQATTAKKRGRLNGAVVRDSDLTILPSRVPHGSKHAHHRAHHLHSHHHKYNHERKHAQSQTHNQNQFQNQFQLPASSSYESASLSSTTEGHLTPSVSAPSFCGIMSPPSSMSNNHKRQRVSSPSQTRHPSNAGAQHDNVSKAEQSAPFPFRQRARFGARQRTLDATALAREAPSTYPETQSQHSQASAVLQALQACLEEDGDDSDHEYIKANGLPKDRQAVVMEMTVPSAATSLDINGSYHGPSRSGRRIPPGRAIVPDGMNWARKRKRSEELSKAKPDTSRLETSAESLLKCSFPVAGDGQLALTSKQLALRIRRHQKAVQEQAEHISCLSGVEQGVWQEGSSVRVRCTARCASVAPSHPLTCLDTTALRWLEDNPEQWAIQEPGISEAQPPFATKGIGTKSDTQCATLPLLFLDHELLRRLLDSSLFAVTAHQAPSVLSGRRDAGIDRRPCTARQTRCDTHCERRTVASGLHVRLRDLVERKLADDAAMRHGDAHGSAGGVSQPGHSFVSSPSTFLTPSCVRSPPRERNDHGRVTFIGGYEWPAEGDPQPPASQQWVLESQMLPPQNVLAGTAPTSTLRPTGRGFVTDSQIKAIFELDEAGLASQQSQQGHVSDLAGHNGQRQCPPVSPASQQPDSQKRAFLPAPPRLEEEDAEQLRAKHAAALALNDLTQTCELHRANCFANASLGDAIGAAVDDEGQVVNSEGMREGSAIGAGSLERREILAMNASPAQAHDAVSMSAA